MDSRKLNSEASEEDRNYENESESPGHQVLNNIKEEIMKKDSDKETTKIMEDEHTQEHNSKENLDKPVIVPQATFTEDTKQPPGLTENNVLEDRQETPIELQRNFSLIDSESDELRLIADSSHDSLNRSTNISLNNTPSKEEVYITFNDGNSLHPNPPTSAPPPTTRKKSGSILKKSASSEKFNTTPKSTDFYVDGSGNIRQITPNDVNTNQFYPDLSNLDASSRATRQDSDDVFGTPEAATRQPSATKTVHFDESGPQITELEDEDRYDDRYEAAEYEDDEDIDSVMRGERPYSAETSDSISLPGTSPVLGFPRESQSEIFATQVDEETLEAAKIRQKRRTYILEGDSMEPVIPVIQTMKEIVEEKAKQHFENGLAGMHSKQWEKAIVSFTKSLNLNPDQVECFVKRGEAYFQLTDFQSAILNYKKACIMQPDEPSHYQRLSFFYFFQGECYYDQKLYPEALEAFSRASEMRPDLVGYHTRCIACLAALQRHGECLALVNKRLETEHSNADLYVLRARLHKLFENITLCYYDVKDALAIDPFHPEAIGLMKGLEKQADDLKKETVQLTLMKKHREALHKISQAIEANPSMPEYHVLRGALQRHLADFNAAIDDYLLALDKTDHNEASPVYLEAQRQLLLTYNDFAVECFTKGYLEEAIILLNKAIKGEKGEKGLYINRGDCFYKQDNLAFALADYHQALELDLEDDSIRSRIAVIHNEFAIREYQDKNFLAAESRLSQAIQFNPRKAAYYISRARIRLLLEDTVCARSDIAMGLHLEPQNKEIKPLIGRLFPGKSIKEVMTGKTGSAARTAIDNLNGQQGGSNRLPPLSTSSDTTSQASVSPKEGRPSSTKSHDSLITWEKGKSLPNLKACMKEKEFNIQLIQEKAQTTGRIQSVLRSKEELSFPSGRVNAFAQPVPLSHQSPGVKLGKLATKETPGVKQIGWKKFSTGIGLGT